MEYMIRTENLIKEYRTGGSVFRALDNVNINIRKGSFTIIMGRSGSGKTTLLNNMSLLDRCTSGEVYIMDKPTARLSDKERDRFRRKMMGIVFQSVALFPMMNAYENVDFALRTSGYEGNRKERIEEVMQIVGLKDRMLHMPGELSGGEQQRVAIARAVAGKPEVLFADEPTGALDTATGIKVVNLFKQLVKIEGISVVMTTHDPGIMTMGDEVYEMSDGVLVSKKRNEVGVNMDGGEYERS